MSEFDREPWIGDARRLLDESTNAFDAATLSRLNRARQSALAGARRSVRTVGWLAAAGVACTAALLLAVALHGPPPGSPSAAPSVATTVARAPATQGAAPARPAAAPRAPGGAPAADDAVAADDSLDFYQDLDFYAWLDAQDGDGDG